MKILDTMKQSMAFPGPQVDVAEYFYAPLSNGASAQGPALTIYLYNIFVKAIIAQFVTESSVRPSTAHPIGILGSSLFAARDIQWEGHSFIDVFLAKFHVVCPVVFGIYGSETSVHGKMRLGWLRTDGAFVPQQEHNTRMMGLGAGFAAMSLRNFDKARVTSSPLPPRHWWRAVADITNTPPTAVTATHFIVLKAMIEGNEGRILEFWGDIGARALRRALVQFPSQSELKDNVAAKALRYLADSGKMKQLFR